MRLAYKFRKAIDKHGNNLLRPEIEVRLVGKAKSQKVIALLDSGADTCFIPRALADRLGIELEGNATTTKGVGGLVSVFDRLLDIEFYSGHEKATVRDVPVSIPLNDEDTSWILLGRNVLFDYFEVVFRQAADQILLKKSEPPAYRL
jgi:hypothetical protein